MEGNAFDGKEPSLPLDQDSNTRDGVDSFPVDSSVLDRSPFLDSDGEEREGRDDENGGSGGGLLPLLIKESDGSPDAHKGGYAHEGGWDFFVDSRGSRKEGADEEEEDGYPTRHAGWRKGGYRRNVPPKDVEGSGEDEEPHGADGRGVPQSEYYPNCDVNIWMRSCEKEVTSPLQGSAKGVIPHWIKGTLLRNGPGRLHFGETSFKHLFDCSALLHRFAINEGKVTYQCRFLRSKTFLKNMAANRIIVTEFGTKAVPDPCQSIFSRVSALFNPGEYQSDNAMISIYPFGDDYYAFTELPVVHRIHPKTLDTLERVNLCEKMGIVSHTSHPHVLEDGTVFNIGMTVGSTGPKYTLFRFTPPNTFKPDTTGDRISGASEECRGNGDSCGPEGGPEGPFEKDPFSRAECIGGVAARWPLHPGYMHSFGITEHFFVIIEQPLSISVAESVKSTLFNEPMAASFRWYQDKPTLFHLLERNTGRLRRTYSADSFFYLHVINSYETGSEGEGEEETVVIDICCYQDPSMLDCMYVEALEGAQSNPDYAQMFHGRPLRFKLPLQNPRGGFEKQSGRLSEGGEKESESRVHPEQICDMGCETPRINYERHLGKKYRYFYAISSDVNIDNPGTMIKVDLETRTAHTWSEMNVFPSEPIFVQSPNAKDEDDGVVLSALVWGKEETDKAGLLVLDAKTWTELGRVEFQLPGPAPKCLHGWFVPGLV